MTTSGNPAASDLPRGRLTTTTVRFDSDLWSELERQARRLGIAKGAFIRDAVLRRLVGITVNEHVSRSTFGDDLESLDRRVARIERYVGRPRR